MDASWHSCDIPVFMRVFTVRVPTCCDTLHLALLIYLRKGRAFRSGWLYLFNLCADFQFMNVNEKNRRKIRLSALQIFVNYTHSCKVERYIFFQGMICNHTYSIAIMRLCQYIR